LSCYARGMVARALNSNRIHRVRGLGESTI